MGSILQRTGTDVNAKLVDEYRPFSGTAEQYRFIGSRPHVIQPITLDGRDFRNIEIVGEYDPDAPKEVGIGTGFGLSVS